MVDDALVWLKRRVSPGADLVMLDLGAAVLPAADLTQLLGGLAYGRCAGRDSGLGDQVGQRRARRRRCVWG